MLGIAQNDLRLVCIDNKSHPANYWTSETSETAVIGCMQDWHNESRFLETLGTLLAHGDYGAHTCIARSSSGSKWWI